MQQGTHQQIDLEKTILLYRAQWDDKNYIKTGITSKDLQRAIMRYGIYDQKMKEAEALQNKRQEQQIERMYEMLK